MIDNPITITIITIQSIQSDAEAAVERIPSSLSKSLYLRIMRQSRS